MAKARREGKEKIEKARVEKVVEEYIDRVDWKGDDFFSDELVDELAQKHSVDPEEIMSGVETHFRLMKNIHKSGTSTEKRRNEMAMKEEEGGSLIAEISIKFFTIDEKYFDENDTAVFDKLNDQVTKIACSIEALFASGSFAIPDDVKPVVDL